MDIHAKLAAARAEFHKLELRKSGYNKFVGFRYFELGDFIKEGLKCLTDAGLVPVISYDTERATMTLHEIEGDGSIVITSPMSTAALKGCHDVQNLGAVQTYLRRYLWTAALEIIEHDALDSSEPIEQPGPSLDEIRARLRSAPDEIQTKAQEWITAKYGKLESMPTSALRALDKRLDGVL